MPANQPIRFLTVLVLLWWSNSVEGSTKSASNLPSKRGRGWTQWFPPRKENATVEEETAEQPPTNETKRLFFNPFKRKEPTKNETTTEEPTVSPEPAPAANATTITNETATVPPATPPPLSNVIVLGSAPPQSYRIIRRPTGPQDMQTPGSRQLSPNYVLLMELAASVLATFTRLWVLRYITTWLARQEESIQPMQHFVWERLNDRFQRDVNALATQMQLPPEGVSKGQWRRKKRRYQGRKAKVERDWASTFRRTVVVIDFVSESKDGPDNAYLGDLVSFLIDQHRRHAFGTEKETLDPMELEVVLLVQSPGGGVASFGLAAEQVRRLAAEPGIKTTVCVDKYAASGGYMIASQAHTLMAAPFASIGSVGVILEGLNFAELARRYGVQPLVIKAGESKNPLTTFGTVTKADLAHEKERLEKVHQAFQNLIVESRPELKGQLASVADGTVFLGQEAVDLKLIDRVMTSSEYIHERIAAGDRVLKLHRSNLNRFPRRVTLSPLDVLPHLRTWVARLRQEPELWSRVVQVGSAFGFVQHLLSRYVFSRDDL